MRSSERWSLMAMCASAALTSAAVVFAVDHYGIVQIAPQRDIELVSGPVELVRGPTPAVPRTAKLLTPSQDLSDRLSETQVARLPAEDMPTGDLPAPDQQIRDAPPEDWPVEDRQVEGVPPENALAEAAPPDEPVERETPEWWSAEVRRDVTARKPAPSLAVAAPQRLPWQMPALGPQPRDKRLAERLAEISPAANQRIAEKFRAAEATWPPTDIALVAIKDEKVLELHARAPGGAWTFIHRYPVLAASGNSGPKLRQGDRQVPEGVYGISFLNPDSRYHVSLRVNYPNAFDRQMAAKDGRNNLGGDIMIHGKNVSIGCLAVGDQAAEELFVLAARVGLPNIKLVIAPTDFRRDGAPAAASDQPKWLPDLYTQVASSMSEFKRPPSNSLLSFFGK
ncbi:MAG: L,D-transpeptidase family protein [Hyphomicrobium sp.]